MTEAGATARTRLWRWAIPFVVASLSAADLHVGVAKRVVTPDLQKHGPVYIAGFGNNRGATGVHDDLHARCMAFQAAGKPLLFCGVDSIGLFLDDVTRIREKVQGDVVVAALHDHEAPDTMGLWGPAMGKTGVNEAYNQLVIERTAEAANEAIRTLQKAKIRLGRVHTPELDTFIDDTRPPKQHDSEVVLLEARDRHGRPIGTLVNWANHPEALGSKNTLLTADYSGYLCARLEELRGGTVVFINGAVGGMQSPLGAKLKDPRSGELFKDGTFEFAELVGRRAAEIAAEGLEGGKKARLKEFVYHEKQIRIPMENENYKLAFQLGVFAGRKAPNPDGTTTTVVGYARFGKPKRPELEIAMIPGEMYPELSVGGIQRYEGADFPGAALEAPIKQLMRAPYRMLFGLANDEIGYIIPKAEWDEKAPWLQNAPKRWYGEVNSVGSEAGPRIAAAFAELVRQ